MRKKIAKTIRTTAVTAVLALGLVGSSGCNLFSEMADKESDTALLYDIQRKLDTQDWPGALTLIDQLTEAKQATREVKFLKATAYAGRCGLNFVSLINTLTNTEKTVMTLLMEEMSAATAERVTDCVNAEATLKEISTDASERTFDENFLLTFVSFAKIGAELAVYADADDDGTVDAAFDPCDTSILPDAAARQIATGFTLAVTSLSAINTDLISSVVSSLDTICDSALATGLCDKTSVSDFTTTEMKLFNGIVDNTQIGVGSCNDSTLLTCVCQPFP